jgi:hypothetical protein
MFPIARPCAPRRALAAALAAGLLMLAPVASAQDNGGFEELDEATGLPRGWRLAGGADETRTIAVDERVPGAAGRRSLRIAHAREQTATRVVQRMAASGLTGTTVATGRRLRLTGYARLEADARALPAVWLRVDGGNGPLFLESAGPAADAGQAPLGWHRYEVELPLPPDVSEIAVGVSLRGAGTVWFDELSLAVATTEAGPEPTPVALRYLERALDLMRDNAFQGATVDWAGLRREALAHARGAAAVEDVHLAVRFALRELGDRHSYLQSPAATRALEGGPVSNALTRSPPAAVRGSVLPDGTAYLAVPGFAGGTHRDQLDFAESISKLIQELDSKNVCGWVVDLRGNRGGNLWPMLVGTGPLLAQGDLAASVYPDGRRASIWYRDGRGGFGDYVQLRLPAPYRARGGAPIATLTSEGTASAAEVLAIALRAAPRTRSFGAPTSGVSSGTRVFPLSDGASLVLVVAATSDMSGRVFLGPIEPDERIASSRAGVGDDPVLEVARAWVAQAGACGAAASYRMPGAVASRDSPHDGF